jgi:hypothetical protein
MLKGVVIDDTELFNDRLQEWEDFYADQHTAGTPRAHRPLPAGSAVETRDVRGASRTPTRFHHLRRCHEMLVYLRVCFFSRPVRLRRRPVRRGANAGPTC